MIADLSSLISSQHTRDKKFRELKHKEFPFVNRSYPGDSESDIMPYPDPVERKPCRVTLIYIIHDP